MSSWVRYSVAVYLGLLISGALARPPWQAPSVEEPHGPRVFHDDSAPPDTIAPPPPHAKADPDVAV